MPRSPTATFATDDPVAALDIANLADVDDEIRQEEDTDDVMMMNIASGRAMEKTEVCMEREGFGKTLKFQKY